MQEYCAYIIGPDGHILNRIDLRCENEDEANGLTSGLGVKGAA